MPIDWEVDWLGVEDLLLEEFVFGDDELQESELDVENLGLENEYDRECMADFLNSYSMRYLG